jgi:cytochrome c-type biogenesis protein CcmF
VRAPTVASRVQYGAFSREALLLANNFIFVISATTVLLGTLFPLVMDALGQGKYSVGPPYFNAVFVPLMALLVPFMGIGPVSRWKQDAPSRWRQELLAPAAVVVVCALVLPAVSLGFNLWVALAILFSGWLLVGLLRDFLERTRSAPGWASKWRRLTPSYLGMLLAHAGFATMIIGVTVVSQHNVEKDLRMLPGDTEEVAGYRFEFMSVVRVAGPNYDADQANFRVFDGNELVAELSPQKRRYRASGQVMTEAAIDPGVFRDLFIAMGEPVGEDAWAIRLQYKPMIRWIWFGALMIGFGAITTAFDRRYRLRDRHRDTAKNQTSLASHAHAKA